MMMREECVVITTSDYRDLVRSERDRELFRKFVEIKSSGDYGLLTDDVRFLKVLLGSDGGNEECSEI